MGRVFIGLRNMRNLHYFARTARSLLMPDDEFYNSIGAFRVASEPRGYHTRRLIASHTSPPPMDKDGNIILGGVVFRKDGTYGFVDNCEC
jgi:hypothetical protein